MTQGSVLTASADEAARRYRVLLMALGSLHDQGLREPEPGGTASIRRITGQAYDAAQGYLSAELPVMRASMAGQRDDALASVQAALGSADEPASERSVSHVDGLADGLEQSLRLQLERDIGGIVSSLRTASLRASVIARSRKVSRRQALVSVRLDAADPAWNFTDRAGRKWASSKYVRTAWRQAHLLAFNETALLAIADHGVSHALINHPDPDHEHAGKLITLSEDEDMPGWDDVRDTVFHPNSNAWLTPAP